MFVLPMVAVVALAAWTRATRDGSPARYRLLATVGSGLMITCFAFRSPAAVIGVGASGMALMLTGMLVPWARTLRSS